jgi:hypothetical protein
MNPVIGKLSKAGSSGAVETGLYPLDRTLSMLRQVRGRARVSFTRFAIFSEARRIFHAFWQAKTQYYRSRHKGNNGQSEAAAMTVFNNSNQK